MLEGTVDPNRSAAVAAASTTDAAAESAQPQAQPRDSAPRRSPAQARTRIWLQAATAIVCLLLLFTAYDVSRRAQQSSGPGPAPADSPSSPRPPLQAEPPLPDDMLAIAGNRMRQPLHAMSLFAGSLNRDALPAQRQALLGLENSMRELADVIDDVERISQLLRSDTPGDVATAQAGSAGDNIIAVDPPRAQPVATTPDDATLFSLALRESESRHGTRSPSRLDAGADAAHGGGAYPKPGNVEPGEVCAAPSPDADATRRG